MSDYICSREHIPLMHNHPYPHVSVYTLPPAHGEALHNDVEPIAFTVSNETTYIFLFLFYFCVYFT